MKNYKIKKAWVMSVLLILTSISILQAQTTNLATHQPISAAPVGATFEWHNAMPIAAGNLMIAGQIAAAGPGLYYGVYNFGTCYGAPSYLRVATNTCPATTVDLKTVLDSTSKPLGMVVSYHTGNPATSVNRISNVAASAAAAGTYFAAYYDTTGMCFANTSPIVILIKSCYVPIPDVNVTYINTAVTGNVSTNDPVGSTYGTPTAVAGNPGAALPVMAANGTYTFTSPVAGVFTFDVPVTMPDGSIKISKLVITVLDNAVTTNKPVANVDIATTALNTAVTLNTLANDASGNPGVALVPSSVTVTIAPTNGTTSVDPVTGNITYTPSAGFVGTDTLTYSVTDANGNVTTAQQIITVNAAGAPNSTVATDDYKTTPFNTTATGSVKTNDSDPEGQTQTITSQTTAIAGKGTLTLLSDGTYTFVPVTGFSGPVEFPYTTTDALGATANATLHILVRPTLYAPTPDVNVTYINTAVTGNVSTNDPVGSTYGTPTAVAGNPGAALPVMAANGTYTFTSPVAGVFTFDVPVTMPDGSIKISKLVITVLDNAVTTNKPVANVDIATTALNTAVTLNTLANDASGNPGVALVPSSVTVTIAPTNGTTSVDPVTGNITYTPSAGFVGTDTLTYSVTDANGNVTTAQQIITVNAAGAPNSTVATDDYKTTPFNTTATGSVKTNDSDPEGQTQTITSQTTAIAGKGTLTLLSDGTYTFVPVTGFSGPVEFPYTTTDALGATANATLHILVRPPLYAPTPDVNVTYINTAVTGNVSTNDPVGSTYGTPTAVAGNPGAALPVMAANGTYTFTSPVAGVFTFDVPVTMPDGSVKISKLVITVLDNAVTTNKPVANVDIATTALNTAVTLNTLANDASGNVGVALVPSSVTVTIAPTNGTTSVDPVTGNITYTPSAGFVGTDTLTYSVTDANGNVTTAQQIITVNAAGAPNSTVATDDYKTTPFNTTATGSVKTNDSDPEGQTQTITAQATTIAGKGTLTLLSDGTYTFVPVIGFSGPVEFPYTTTDALGATANATLHILVQPTLIILPVQLISFNAYPQGEATMLNWEVGQEINIGNYQVEYSKDGINFIGVGSITALHNSNYNFLHNLPQKGLNYYRLKIVDKDGTFAYSQIRIVNFAQKSKISIYPNPVSTGVINITLTGNMINKIATVSILSMEGKLISQQQIAKTSQTETIDVSTLASGTYIVRLITDAEVVNKTIQVIR